MSQGFGHLQGAREVDYRGSRFALGRTSDAYAIWDLAGGPPVRTFALSDEAWPEAWLTYQAWEAGTPSPTTGEAPPPTRAETPTPAPTTGLGPPVGPQPQQPATAVMDYPGARYGLGRAEGKYFIWDLEARTAVESFPVTQEGWSDAWVRFQELERPYAYVPTRMWQKGQPIPLRGMRVGQILDGAFKLYRMYFWTLVAVVGLVVVLSDGLYLALTLGTGERVVLPGFQGESFEIFTPPTWVGWVDVGLQVLITPFITGAVVTTIGQAYLTGRPSIGGAYRAALPRIHSILWLTLLIGIPIFLIFLPAILVVIGAGVQQEPGLVGLAFLLVLLGMVPAIFLAIRWSFSTAVLMVEGIRGTAAMRRSWNLCRGMGWKVLGTMLLAILILIGVLFVVGLLAAVFFFFSQADALSQGGLSITPAFFIVNTAIQAVLDVLTTPFLTLVIVLLYFDLRIRKEGLDLEVMAQQVGLPSAPGA